MSRILLLTSAGHAGKPVTGTLATQLSPATSLRLRGSGRGQAGVLQVEVVLDGPQGGDPDATLAGAGR